MKNKMIIMLIILSTASAYAQSYKIDSSFGINGIQHLMTSRELAGIAVRPNNDIVLCGYNNVPQSMNYQLAVNALKFAGQIDISFGIQGNATTWFDSLTYAYDCAIQADGKIIAVGTYSSGNTPIAPAVHHAFVVRYFASGTIDSSFGSNGIVLVNAGDECNFAKVKILPNGKILAAGNIQNGATFRYLLVQFNSSGNYDLNFGNGGMVTTLFPHEAGLWDLDILQDGSIIASGNEGPYDPSPNPNFDIQMCMIKYSSAGIVDSNFGTNGIVYLNMDPYTDDVIHNLHEQSDGKLIATGVGNNQGVIARFLSDGTIDSTYDGDGIKSVGHVTRISVLQQNDKLVTANNYLNGAGQDIELVRYNVDASLDTTFGINGTINHDVPGTNNYIQNAALDNLNNIIVCGSSDSGSIVARYSLTANGPAAVLPLENDIPQISIYPNPVSNELYCVLNAKSAQTVQIQLLNMNGEVMSTNLIQPTLGGQATKYWLPVSDLISGRYVIKMMTADRTEIRSFIKL